MQWLDDTSHRKENSPQQSTGLCNVEHSMADGKLRHRANTAALNLGRLAKTTKENPSNLKKTSQFTC